MAAKDCPNDQGAAPKNLFWKMVAAVCVCNCAHFYTICSLFSYAGILAADLHWAVDRDHAGTIAGYLQSANVIGRVPTSLLWGYFGDRFGLRCALVVGMLSLLAGCLLFGLCTTAVTSILVRFVFLGMGNSWVTIFPAISMEIGGPEKQTAVVGMILGTGAVVQLLGPAIGGWTYDLVEEWPALVPNLAGSGICLLAVAATLLWLPSGEARSKSCDEVKADIDATIAGDTPGFASAICRRPVPLLIWMRSTCGFLNFAFFEVVPLWAISSSRVGGLAMEQDVLGTVFAASAVLSGLFMIFCLQKVTQRCGLRTCSLIANLCNALLFASMPFVGSVWILTGMHALMNSCMGTTEAAYIAFVNNSVDADSRARVNGACAMCESLGKAFGPFSMAVLFAWSLDAWGFAGHFVVFFVLAFLHLSLAIATLFLPGRVEGVEGVEGAKATAAAPAAEDAEDIEGEDNENSEGDGHPACELVCTDGIGRRHAHVSEEAAAATEVQLELSQAGSNCEAKEMELEEETSPLRPRQ